MNYINRKNTNSTKWDGQTGTYGEEGLHPMWVADMDFQVPSCVQKALHQYVDMGAFGYYRIPDSYYQACIDWEAENHGYKMQKEWICFSPGVVSAFNWIIQFMTNPGDSVIVMTPVYYPFLNAVKNNNRKLITSDLINDKGVYTIDFKDFENKIVKNETKLFILCSPHNPVGRVWTKDELKTIFEICRKYNVFVISDEIHQDLTYENTHVPSFSVGDYEDMMISIMAPSKTFNLAAAQNSEVIIPNEHLRERWNKYINEIRVTGGNAFGYVAAEAAYRDGKEWLEDVRAQIHKNYLFLCSELKEHFPQIIISPLEGTYLSWVDLSAYVKPEEMKDFIQNKCRLAVDYGDWFGGTRFSSFIRLNLATSLENVKITTDAIINNLKLM